MPDKYDEFLDSPSPIQAKDKYDDFLDSPISATQEKSPIERIREVARKPFQIAGQIGAKAHEGYGKIEELVGKGGAKYGPGFAAVGIPATMATTAAKLLIPKSETEAEMMAAIPVAGKIAGPIVKMAQPGLAKFGSQMLKVATGIPEKYGEAALKDLGNLSKAKSKDIINASYRAFEGYTGLKSLRNVGAERGELLLKPGRAEEIINNAYQKVSSKQPVAAQELYEASQAARYLKDQARFGDPNQLANLSNLNRAKTSVDDALQAIYPEYKNLRSDTFLSKMGEQFSSWLPLNKNQSANALRGWSALVGGIGGVASGHPAALLGIPAMAPKIAGSAIRTAGAISKAAPVVSRFSAPGVLFVVRMKNGQTVEVQADQAQEMARSGQGSVIQIKKQ